MKQYPLVFKYMEWCIIENCTFNGMLLANTKDKILDGNDMVAAINKMVEKEDWLNFREYVWFKCPDEVIKSDSESDINALFENWLFQPNRFFDLMEAWRKEAGR